MKSFLFSFCCAALVNVLLWRCEVSINDKPLSAFGRFLLAVALTIFLQQAITGFLVSSGFPFDPHFRAS